MNRNREWLVLLLVGMVLLAACSSDKKSDSAAEAGLAVTDAWVRATVPGDSGGGMTGAFMVIENHSSQEQRLLRIEVDTDTADTVEIHETTMGENAVMQMRPVDGIQLPAAQTVELKPGGYHVMLLGLKKALDPGDTLSLTLHFDSGQTITVQADVRAMESGS